MPIELQWVVAERLIHTRLNGYVAPADVTQFADQVREMMESVETPLVHNLVDLAGLERFSTNIADYMQLSLQPAPNAGWIMIIGGNAMMRFVLNILTSRVGRQFSDVRIAYVASYAEAIEFVVARDPHLTEERITEALAARDVVLNGPTA